MVSNQNHFTIFHFIVLTTLLDYRQVVLDHWWFANQCAQLGTLKHTPHLYPRHKQDQPTTLLLRGLGPRPNLDSKPPHLSPGLSVVLRSPPSPPPISRFGKSRNPWQESNEPSRPHKRVCAQGNKCVTWLESNATDGPQSTQAKQLQSESRSNAKPSLDPKYHSARSPIIIHIYFPGDNNITAIIISFLSLASDRQSLDFYRSSVA